MTNTQKQITDYILEMNQAQTPLERSAAYRKLMSYHYFLPKSEQEKVDELMRPYLEKIETMQLPPDPVLQRAEELLSRTKMRIPHVQKQ